MSRRKQARPRHVDDPDLDSPAIVNNSEGAVFQEEGEKPADDSNHAGADDTVDAADDNQKSTGEVTEDQNFQSEAAKVCSKCQAQFSDINDLLLHQKDCLKPVMLLFKENQSHEMRENQSDPCHLNGFSSNASDNHDDNTADDLNQNENNGEPVNENFSEDEAEADNEENQSNFDHIDSEYSKSVDDREQNNDDVDDDEADFDRLKENSLGEKIKGNPTAADITAYMRQLSSLIPTMGAQASSNVMLEPIEQTKAAVAQFAENNPDQEKDVDKLQTALYKLQQQQLLQLQWIHQLQQHLVTSGPQNGQFPGGNGQLPLGTNFPAGLNLLGLPGALNAKFGHLSRNDSAKDLSSKSSSRHESPSPKSESPSPAPKDLSDKSRLAPPRSRSVSPARSESISPTSAPISASASEIGESPVSLLMTAASKAGSHTGSGSPGLLSFGIKGSETGESYAGSNDDPFFKHKCRLCGKVFGSDSALQIHIRSHTGEKPFQCNICGGRFSTRGNLKVHFQRHKAEFPNVEMNPNPVPEHLDKNPMPMMPSPFPAGALTPFANPAFMMPGLMNGFMFPPPSMGPRHSIGHHPLMPKPPGLSFEDRELPSPKRQSRDSRENRDSRESSSSKLPPMRKDTSPITSMPDSYQKLADSYQKIADSYQKRMSSPERKENAKRLSSPLSMSSSLPMHLSQPSPILPVSSVPLVSTYPVMSPLPSQPPFAPHRAPMMTPTSLSTADPFRNTILPSNLLDNDDNLEQFMEIDKSETSKLQQLVDNIEHKLTDPNQCVICHRVLSCKSALQMHYRIHTGERPFKCKICGRSFTTKGNLKTHMGVHRAKPPLRMMHQCPVCHKQFTNLLVLQQHIRSHTGMSGLPPIPGLNHLGMFAQRPPMEDPMNMNYGPLNLKRHFSDDNEKELDLSKKPRLQRDDDKSSYPDLQNDGDMSGEINDGESEIDFQNEMDDEADKLAADEARKEGLAGSNSDDQSNLDDSQDSRADDEQSRSRQPHSFKDVLGRSGSPKYLQEDSNQGESSGFNAYSTSLAALEERVRSIDTTMARNPLSQFHAAPFLLAPSYNNGEGPVSPRSESGSDEGHRMAGDGSLSSNYLLGAIDGQALEANGKGTTCNVCYKTFACKSALDIHYRSHTRERPYKCELCDKSFTTRGNMKQHLLTHELDGASGANSANDSESNNNNSCTPNQNDTDNEEGNNDDSSNTESQDAVKPKTEQTESQVKFVKDGQSGSSTEKPASVTATQAASNGSSSSTSSQRTASFSNSNASDSQSPFVSKTPTVKHQCLVCQKGFSSASALQIHIRTHTGDKPFKCTVCGKAFTTKGNLKVHMGTHMWNNSPSRRGRRMSIEPPFMLGHKENPFIPHGFPPRPEFYPFQFPPFINGLPTPPKSMGDIGLLHSMHSRLGMKTELSSPPSDDRRKAETSPINEDKPKYAESGELDLSMKSAGSSGSRSSEKASPSSVDSNSSSGMISPPHMSLGWGWKASCHLCSRSFPTPAALEHHIRSMHMTGMSLPKVEAS